MEIIECELKDPEASKFYEKIVIRIDKTLGKQGEAQGCDLMTSACSFMGFDGLD